MFQAISVWEKATFLILQREAVVAKLESFERMASDPNRFFEKGYRGSSVARLEEAKLRAQFYRVSVSCKIISYFYSFSFFLNSNL